MAPAGYLFKTHGSEDFFLFELNLDEWNVHFPSRESGGCEDHVGDVVCYIFYLNIFKLKHLFFLVQCKNIVILENFKKLRNKWERIKITCKQMTIINIMVHSKPSIKSVF